MPTKAVRAKTRNAGKSNRTQPAKSAAQVSGSTRERVTAVVAWLERTGTQGVRDGMARYAIPSDKAFGISVGALRQHAKRLGRDHELAAALWDTGWYEARMLATFVEDPALLTPAQMDRWCRDFDSWAICDTACFGLFDRSPHAWKKVEQWSSRKDEFQKRGGYALMACLALHAKDAGDAPFVRHLRLIEQGAADERNFVKKAVNWALRAIGGRSPVMHAASLKLARKLAKSPEATPRWIGKDALRGLEGPAMARRVARSQSKK